MDNQENSDGDLRLLLSGGEGGGHLAKDALPRGETHPDTPSRPSALREASCSFCGRREGEVVALMFGPRVDLAICDQCAQVAACEGDGQKSAALTDPRQPSEAPVTADAGWIKRSDAVTAIRLFPLGHNAILHGGEGGRFVSAAVAEAMIARLPAPPTGEGAHKRYPSTGLCVVCGENCDNETRAFPTGEGGWL